MICAKLFGPVVLEKKSKIGKVYRRTNRQTKGDQKSSGELKKKLLNVLFNTVIARLNTVLKICSKRPLILCDVSLFHTVLII